MKLVSGSLLVALISSAAWAAAPEPVPTAATTALVQQPAAAPASKIELARRFVGLTMPPDAMIESMRDSARQITAKLEEQLGDGDNPGAQQRLDKFLARLEPRIRAQMPAILEAQAQAYAREFSQGELEQLVGFAQSPAGRHYLSGADAVEADPAVAAAQQALWADITTALQNEAKEICAEKAAQRLAAGDKKAACPLSQADKTAAG
jgi:hypothetical protein